jgi:hypothetical protein
VGRRAHDELHLDFGEYRRHHLRPRHHLDEQPVQRRRQDSRPEAWAKNIFSMRRLRAPRQLQPRRRLLAGRQRQHRPGGRRPHQAGPERLLRQHPLLGPHGQRWLQPSGDYYTNFGGTSGATPIVAGHNAIAIQMFTDGLFSPQRVPNGTRWQNKPQVSRRSRPCRSPTRPSTLHGKTSTDNRREHVGWGMPNLKTMYDNRNVHFVVDETDVLKQGEGMAYTIHVAAGEPELKISMCFADPAGNPSAALTSASMT